MPELSTLSLASDGSLKAYYKLENVNDSGGGGFTLTNNNSVAFNAAKFTNGADLGSANTNKTLSSAGFNLSASASWSVSFWVKITGTPGTFAFFYLGDNTNHNSLRADYDGTNFHYIRRRQNIANDILSSAQSPGATFHHIVLTYNGSVVGGYYDGASVGTTSSSGNGSGGTEADEIRIGSENNGGPAAFASAIIDDFALFTRVLSQSEVSAIYGGTTGAAFLLNFI